MSNRNNDVFAVLPTVGNQVLLAAGNPVSSLLPGQLGCFDVNTGLSVASLATVRAFEFAVGIDDGAGALGDMRKSAGQFIQGPRTPNGDHPDHELVQLSNGDVIAVGYKSYNANLGTFIERYNPISDSWATGSSINPIHSR